MRTLVTFRSTAFNTTKDREYFVNNPGCVGGDLAKWLTQQLCERGLHADAGAEQWFPLVAFRVDGTDHNLVIGYRPGEDDSEGDWICWIERRTGIVAVLLGLQKRGIRPAATDAIDEALSSSPEIRNVRWHTREDFDKGREELGSETP
jgi:hypothetical protein